MNVTQTRRAFALMVVASLLAVLLVPLSVATAPSARAATKQASVQHAIKNLLTVRSETNSGYERAKFKHWIDSNGDCQNTRAEVLIQESKKSTTGRCTITSGKWSSYYDRKTWTKASDVDIDHLVPLAEAWGSGAKKWTADTRKRFANDLSDKRVLVAVTDNVNQSKGAKDPATWLPKYNKCKYVRDWVGVKLRWKLTINSAEKTALLKAQKKCSNSTIKWKPATVKKASTSTTSSSISGGLRITKVVYDPSGDERYSPNKEQVYIKNVSGSKKNLKGVVLSDPAGHKYTLPSYGLGSGKTVQVHSGKGSNGSGHLYARWNTAVWNNSGDTARLKSSTGKLIDKCTWSGGGVSVSC